MGPLNFRRSAFGIQKSGFWNPEFAIMDSIIRNYGIHNSRFCRIKDSIIDLNLNTKKIVVPWFEHQKSQNNCGSINLGKLWIVVYFGDCGPTNCGIVVYFW